MNHQGMKLFYQTYAFSDGWETRNRKYESPDRSESLLPNHWIGGTKQQHVWMRMKTEMEVEAIRKQGNFVWMFNRNWRGNHRQLYTHQHGIWWAFSWDMFIWLVVFGHPSEKYESQLGWWHQPKSYGKMPEMSTSHHQPVIPLNWQITLSEAQQWANQTNAVLSWEKQANKSEVLGGELPTNRKWVSSPWWFQWDKVGAMSTYNWGYNPLTKWDEPPSTLPWFPKVNNSMAHPGRTIPSAPRVPYLFIDTRYTAAFLNQAENRVRWLSWKKWD